MLDTFRIRTRTKEIRRRLTLLDKRFEAIKKEDFLKDEGLNAEAERHLQVAIQACIDIANHIVSSLGLEMPGKNISDVFYSLAEEKIIPGAFVKTMVKVTGYRNVLVHEYIEVNREETYNNFKFHLKDISEYAQYIEKFLEKRI